MDHICFCGDELVVSVSNGKMSTYCQSCGREEDGLIPDGITTVSNVPVVTLNRAAILKKMNDKSQQETKKPKQIRDRTDYTKSRRYR